MTEQISLTVSAGEAIIFTGGAYEQYELCGHVSFVKDCDLTACAAEFNLASNNRNFESFPTWLVENGYCVRVKSREIWLGGGPGVDTKATLE